MVLKILFFILFSCLFIYSFIRPFSSYFAKWFLRIGSIAGVLSITDSYYLNNIASFLGISSGSSLFLYMSFITIFMFVFYTAERFSGLENKISKLTSEISLLSSRDKGSREKD